MHVFGPQAHSRFTLIDLILHLHYKTAAQIFTVICSNIVMSV